MNEVMLVLEKKFSQRPSQADPGPRHEADGCNRFLALVKKHPCTGTSNCLKSFLLRYEVTNRCATEGKREVTDVVEHGLVRSIGPGEIWRSINICFSLIDKAV